MSWLHRHHVPAAVAVCAVASVLLLARIAASGRGIYLFLGFNLGLAVIPYVASLGVSWAADRGWRVAALVLAATWAAFLPNAPYLVTDLVHLRERAGAPYWYDIGLFAAFAGAGLFLGLAALANVHDAVVSRSRALAATVVVAMIPAVGLGITIGRFLRFNSWDLATRPLVVVAEIAGQVLSPADAPRTLGMSVLYALLFGAAWLAFRSGNGRTEAA